jgi:MHS family alpha-ketoglutarate permease-like MFS transporter
MRPICGWLFGRIANRKGRKTSMVISVTMMCAGSLAIDAAAPPYARPWRPRPTRPAGHAHGLQVGARTSRRYSRNVGVPRSPAN